MPLLFLSRTLCDFIPVSQGLRRASCKASNMTRTNSLNKNGEKIRPANDDAWIPQPLWVTQLGPNPDPASSRA